MGHLTDIQTAILDGENLAGVLRRCLVLSYKLKSHQFQAWVNRELEGYKDGDFLPEYRVVACLIRGTVEGGGYRRTNTSIPIGGLEDDLFEHLLSLRLDDPIATIEQLAMGGDDSLRLALPMETCLILGQQFNGARVTDAYRLVSREALAGTLDIVRTRILKFVCELQSSHPDAGTDAAPPPPPEAIINTMQSTILIELSRDAIERLNDLGTNHVLKKDRKLSQTLGQKVARAVGDRVTKEVGDEVVSDIIDKVRGD